MATKKQEYVLAELRETIKEEPELRQCCYGNFGMGIIIRGKKHRIEVDFIFKESKVEIAYYCSGSGYGGNTRIVLNGEIEELIERAKEVADKYLIPICIRANAIFDIDVRKDKIVVK